MKSLMNQKRNTFLPLGGGLRWVSCLLCVLCVFCASCGDDDEKHPLLNMGNDNPPSWNTREGLYSEMELTMSIQVTLQDELLRYASDEDLMCATIDGEVRAVSPLKRTGGEAYFELIIAGKSGSGKVTLMYYCKQLKRIYTITDWMPFTPNIPPTNDGTPYVVEFIPKSK